MTGMVSTGFRQSIIHPSHCFATWHTAAAVARQASRASTNCSESPWCSSNWDIISLVCFCRRPASITQPLGTPIRFKEMIFIASEIDLATKGGWRSVNILAMPAAVMVGQFRLCIWLANNACFSSLNATRIRFPTFNHAVWRTVMELENTVESLINSSNITRARFSPMWSIPGGTPSTNRVEDDELCVVFSGSTATSTRRFKIPRRGTALLPRASSQPGSGAINGLSASGERPRHGSGSGADMLFGSKLLTQQLMGCELVCNLA